MRRLPLLAVLAWLLVCRPESHGGCEAATVKIGEQGILTRNQALPKESGAGCAALYP